MAFGDPHFYTFDGSYIRYQGDCTYLLAGVCCDKGWQVYVSASRCWWGSPMTCVDRVIVKINGYTIDMPRFGPLTVSWVKIYTCSWIKRFTLNISTGFAANSAWRHAWIQHWRHRADEDCDDKRLCSCSIYWNLCQCSTALQILVSCLKLNSNSFYVNYW